MKEPLQLLFDYTARSHPKINEILYQCLCGEIDKDTFELKSLLKKSLQDGVDYLPEKYHYQAEDFMGDPNADLID